MGLVISTHDTPPEGFMPKEITGIIPLQTTLNERLTDFILWVSDYYMALPGEVMKAAIPSADDLVSRSVPQEKTQFSRQL